MCSNKIFKIEPRTRYMVQWTDKQLQAIQQNIDMYSNLKGYSFDSLYHVLMCFIIYEFNDFKGQLHWLSAVP